MPNDDKDVLSATGVVLDPDERPVADATVFAVWPRLRDEVPIGETRSGPRGAFRLALRLPGDAAVTTRIQLVARQSVADASRPADEVRSALLLPRDAVDVTLRFAPTEGDEYTRLLARVRVLLGQLALTELVESPEHADLSFLARELSIPAETIMQLVVAARAGERGALPADVLFGFLRLGVPAGLPSPLLEVADRFTLVDALVEHVLSLIVAVDPETARDTIKRAIARRIIPSSIADQLDKLLTRWGRLRERQTLESPFGTGKTPLRALLATAELAESKYPRFVEAWQAHAGSATRFWQSLTKPESGFSADEVAALRRTLDVGVLVKNHVPMLQVVQRALAQRGDAPISEFARLDAEDWISLVRQAGPDAVPPNIAAAGGEEPAVLYAREIQERVQRRYPTTALAARAERGGLVPQPLLSSVATFFRNSPTLDLTRANLGVWIEANRETAFAGIEEPEQAATLAQVQRMQRVLRISRDPLIGAALLEAQLDSAAGIRALGRVQAITRLRERGLSPLEAERVFTVASGRYNASVALYLRFNQGLQGIYPAATGPAAPFGEPIETAIRRNPSLANLFGSQDGCAVDPCTSILSPAAYLTDLLLWLRGRLLAGPFGTALAAFAARRPDVLNLKLDCPNTYVALPYIDLINELLEDAVSPPGVPLWRQTTRTAPELRAAPEYVNDAAYVPLAAASFPHQLPYDRAFDELTTVLAQSEVTLWQLREALAPATGPVPAAQATAIAAARFGVSPAEAPLVTTPNAQPLAAVWNTAAPVTDLAVVAAFLQVAQIEYDALLQLLDCVWPRDGGAAITISGAADSCDTSVQRVVGLDAGKLDRLHRFLRVWRRTGWAIWEVDELLRAPQVGNGALDEAALRRLFIVDRLRASTGLAIEALLAFWQDIGTTPHRAANGAVVPPQYRRLFENPVVPPDPALAMATLLAGPAVPLAAHLDAVRAALALSPEETATLVPLTDGQLTLATLSTLYRCVTLVRALKLSLDDASYLAGGTLTAVFADPAATLAFTERVRALGRAGLGTPVLRYVLTRGGSAGRTEAQLAAAIGSVRAALQQVHDDIQNSSDPASAILQRQLATLPQFRDAATLATAMSIVDGSFAGSAGDRNAFIAANFASFMDVAAAQAALALPLVTPAAPSGPREAEIATRAGAILQPLERWLTETRAVAAAAAAIALAPDVATLLAERVLVPATPRTLLSALTDPALIARDPVTGAYLAALTPAGVPEQFTTLALLDKLSQVVRALRLGADELDWLLDNAPAIGGLSLRDLPVRPAQADQSVDAWLTTTRFLLLDRTFTAIADSTAVPAPAIPTLRALVAAVIDGTLATDAGVHAALAAIAGWRSDEVAAAAGAIGATLASGAWQRTDTYERVRRLVGMATATGATVAQLVAWGAATPTIGDANAAWQALKSRYAAEDWLAVAPALMDPIRERRRDALVWFLLAQRDGGGNPVWGVDTADLFGRFLLDTQMSACQVTTRIVQAYGAVQLFVQRALMNLERDVPADPASDDGWLQWQWRDRYRIWEAARKVFLWPENWLIEAQRPSRSEIFETLDQEVHQKENTRDNLELAALGYLDRLAEVSHMWVSGMCSDPRTGTLHVVARTTGDPPRYVHRTFENRQWSAWRRIPLDIKANGAIPAMYAGRLHLFWLDVTVSPEPQQRLPAAQTGPARDSEPAARHVEIRLSGSVVRGGVWMPAQVAREHLFDVPLFAAAEATYDNIVAALYSLRARPAGSSLLIDVFRRGPYYAHVNPHYSAPDAAQHIGRAHFDGRFNALELRDLRVWINGAEDDLLQRARRLYGATARDLVLLSTSEAEPDMPPEPAMRVEAGALVAQQRNATDPNVAALGFGATVATGTLLRSVPLPYRVVGLSNDLPFTPASPFVFNDRRRSWFFEPTRYWLYGSLWQPLPPSAPGSLPTQLRFTVRRFDHPYVRMFWHVLSSSGFDGFFRPEVQRAPDGVIPGEVPFNFSTTYQPVSPTVRWGSDTDAVEFQYSAPVAGYNWELFLHLPYFIAGLLAMDQRFEDARRWYHYIFDPTRASSDPVPQRYWITKPLAELTSPAILAQRIDQLLAAVNRRDADAVGQVQRWQRDPFNPYLLAELRPVAFMKRVVMSYLDNLIAWGDALFTTASREALNEATLLYVLAAELLGPRPQLIPPPARASSTWLELEPLLDAFANAMVAIENLVPSGSGGGGGGGGAPLPEPQTFYFKIPPNDRLLAYWSTVDNRLFKLRHCLGIGGEALALPLFDAPIDPALLVRARASGADLSSLLLDLGAPLPSYRFSAVYRRAIDYAEAVQALGQRLLDTLERRDAEALATLLLTQRRRIHADTEQVLAWRLAEEQALRDALQRALKLYEFQVQDAEESPFMSAAEIVAVSMKSTIIVMKLINMVAMIVSSGLSVVPQFLIGAAGIGGSPQAGAETGGKSASDAVEKATKAQELFADTLEKGAELVKGFAEAEKRAEDTEKEGKVADFRAQETRSKLAAAELRIQIAQARLDMHQRGADDLAAEFDFLRTKFTSQDLYDWMVGQLSRTYFGAYRVAHAMARRAERCYGYELGLQGSTFIAPGYWDSLRRGLLAGEGLALDLRRLESSYLELDVRRKEITRTVSLLTEFPDRLLTLLLTGACEVVLPELLFDRDYPGHYQRRITRVSVTVARAGAAADDNVVLVLTLLENSVRLVPTIGADYARAAAPAADPRFADQLAAVQGIVTGNAIDDAGLFVRDIADNLADPRYLPFEGAGAISRWRIELPVVRNAIDLSTVSDVKLHLHYTALDGGLPLGNAAQAAVDAAAPSSITAVFDPAARFPDAWQRFLAGAGGAQELVLPLRPGLLPAPARGRTATITRCDIRLLSDDSGRFEVALAAPFPNAVTAADPMTAGAPVSAASIAVASLPLQSLRIRVRERGSADWTSMPVDRLGGMLVGVQVDLA